MQQRRGNQDCQPICSLKPTEFNFFVRELSDPREQQSSLKTTRALFLFGESLSPQVALKALPC